MRRYPAILLAASVLPLHALGCSDDSGEMVAKQPTDLDIVEVARSASKGVGAVGRTREGKNATPIVVLEENHASRAGQIQHAITLVRLWKNYGMKHIALEGYLKEREKLSTDWYARAVGGDVAARARVAVSFLQEGEISCAEFIFLVYDDVHLHRIEEKKDYSFDLSHEASAAPLFYLMRIAEQSLSQTQIRRVNAMQIEFQSLSEGAKKNEKIQEMLDYVLESDPWVKEKSKMLRDIDTQLSMSTQEMVKAYEEIADRGRKSATAEERKAMKQHLDFMRGRAAADKTMAKAASAIANQNEAELVAMIVGALHTDPICDFLDNWGRPFAVVTPLAYKNKDKRGDLPYEMYERKYKRLPVHSEGLYAKLLFDAFGKKPEPVTSQKWFQADAEIRLFTDRIVKRVLADGSGREGLGSPKIPPRTDSPPYGFSDDDLNGKWVSIDPEQIEIVDDDPSRTRVREQYKTVLFPVRFSNGKTVWVKATPNRDVVISRDQRDDVEAMLQRALENVQNEDKPTAKREDEAGRIRSSFTTIAAVGIAKQAARNVRLIN